MSKMEIATVVLAVSYAALTALAHALKPGKAKTFCARVALYLGEVEQLMPPPKGDALPPPPKLPPLPCLALVAMLVGGCSASTGAPKPPPRETVRAGLVLVAEVVKELDHACAQVASSMAAEDASPSHLDDPPPPHGAMYERTGAKLDAAIELARKCSDGYTAARDGLLAVQDIVDGAYMAKVGEIGCAVSHALIGLEELIAALRDAGIKDLPVEVEDAVAVAVALSKIGGMCPVGTAVSQ